MNSSASTASVPRSCLVLVELVPLYFSLHAFLGSVLDYSCLWQDEWVYLRVSRFQHGVWVGTWKDLTVSTVWTVHLQK
jgi:hypothetical protein